MDRRSRIPQIWILTRRRICDPLANHIFCFDSDAAVMSTNAFVHVMRISASHHNLCTHPNSDTYTMRSNTAAMDTLFA